MGKEEIWFQGTSKFPLGHIPFPTHEKREGETGGGRAEGSQTGCECLGSDVIAFSYIKYS